MDRLRAMRAFVLVAEEEGFAAAGKRAGLSPPAVTRAVSALEGELGTRLLQRTTRVVRLTEAGRLFLADCRRILGEVDEAMTVAAGAQGEPRGRVAVTAPTMFGRRYLAPVVVDYLARHGQVSVQTLFLDRLVDLIEEGVDVAVRIAHLADSSLSAIKVGTMRRVVCASPAYVEANGAPLRPEDLARHEAIAFSMAAPERSWSFPAGGRLRRVRPRTRLVVNTAEMAVAAALAGLGVARVLAYQVEPELRAGRLVILLAEFEPPPLPIHVVHVEGRRASARVRAFVDLAVERLRAGLDA